MKRERALRIVGAGSGLAAAVLLLSSVIFGDIGAPAVSHSSSIAAAVVENQQSVFVGSYLLMLGVFFFILFAAYLRGQCAADEGAGWLPNAAFAGGLVASAMLLLSAHFDQALTILSGYGNETQVAKSLYLLKWNWYLLVEAIPLALFAGAHSVYGLLRRRWTWWINWPGLALALLLLLPYVTGGGVMLSYLWIGAVSIHLLFTELKGNRS